MRSKVKKLKGLVWLDHLKIQSGLSLGQINRKYLSSQNGDVSGLGHKWASGRVSPSEKTVVKFSKIFPGSETVYAYPIFYLLGGHKISDFKMREIEQWLDSYIDNCAGEDKINADIFLWDFRGRGSIYLLCLKDALFAPFVNRHPLFSITLLLSAIRRAETYPMSDDHLAELIDLLWKLLPVLRLQKGFFSHATLLGEAIESLLISKSLQKGGDRS